MTPSGSAEPAAVPQRTVLLGAGHALCDGRTGRGVTIAVIDSGVNPANPHVAAIARLSAVAADTTLHDDALDRLGHGTAVVAAIQEKAPDAEIHVIRVFHDRLSTTPHALVRAMELAVADGARILNLSLGTVRPQHAARLAEAVEHAHAHGAIVVSPAEHDGEPWYPGAHPLAAGVLLDFNCPRENVVLEAMDAGIVRFRASGYPRPIPGVAPERNVRGISFAAANVTGVLACVLEARPDIRSVAAIAR